MPRPPWGAGTLAGSGLRSQAGGAGEGKRMALVSSILWASQSAH